MERYSSSPTDRQTRSHHGTDRRWNQRGHAVQLPKVKHVGARFDQEEQNLQLGSVGSSGLYGSRGTT